ncbi:sigma-54 interaction domain-containing protein [Alteribacillus bidgolensis]|uniref:Arginine utilization regulatory protein n=1 Tax=Alteribacillus bidgolensis TaxID=930129 RepID=A0A1G8K5M3_9BACI|nr:sigma 54-interacting transcriptional regulator [Alteribacillus bidgolensis]SDI38734.1 arginine utilization regulatory protein [Alteribacillus bidgolensis]
MEKIQSLTNEQQRFIDQFMFDQVDQGIRVIDLNETPIIYNEKMKSIESMTLDDLSDKKITDLFQFHDERDSRLLQAIHHGKTTKNKKQTYLNYKGEEITTVNHIFPIHYDGKVIAAAEIAKDVTKIERLIRDNLNRQGNTRYRFDSIIGTSPEMKSIIENAKRATRTSSSVLIVGETGTGKELFVQSIHSGSSRGSGPYISQNCAALPESLIEGILFGTVKGAFTGAIERPGLFEEAEGGTLMLDEINSLPTSLQAKLLRAIQEKKITRIGDHKERPIDVRILATINEDPIEAITNNRLRKDLYYRLSVVTLFVPPLRERKSDIPLLVETFIKKYNQLFQMNVAEVSNEVFDLFYSYDWPGNVRELEHVIEGAMNFMFEEEALTPSHLPVHFQNKTKNETNTDHQVSANNQLTPLLEGESLRDRLYDIEQNFIIQTLEKYHYNVNRAAKELGISRQSLQYRMEKFNIKRP